MTTYLEDILERKRREVRALDVDLGALTERVTRCRTEVLPRLRTPGRLSVIAEHKRRSPSRGALAAQSDAAAVGAAYSAAGAAAISVLTDGEGFGGSPDDLRQVKAAVDVPVLCKDFIVSPLQVLLAREWGADLVLLIVAALSPAELARLHALAESLGMTPLVEVHDAHELTVAANVGARLIGVNTRNLHTFEVDLGLAERLAARFPSGAVRVAESGIRTAADARRMRDAGYHAILVGEQFMATGDPGRALAAMLAEVG